jgi:DNA-directed RNA polymerase specialized sigma24 family protein
MKIPSPSGNADSLEPVATTPAKLACAAFVGQLAEVEFRLLPESDADVVTEHLSECPNCRLFREQLDTTRELVAGSPATELTADILEVAKAELADGRIERTIKALYRIASTLDVDDADELVQETLIDAISRGTALNSVELIDALIRSARRTRSDPTVSLNDVPDHGFAAYDTDSETAELFYPDFYAEGPDVGRFVDTPNVWGYVFHMGPDDEVAASELIEVADEAIRHLPGVEKRLITLVDLDRVSFEDAAMALHLQKRCADSLEQEHSFRRLTAPRPL